FVDRARYLGDPDFVQTPIDRLTSKSYAAGLRRTIQPDRATASAPTQVQQGFESSETTHYSVVDGSGMAVSVTYTLENGYGLGAAHSIRIDPVTGARQGAADPRDGDAGAAGY